MWVSTIFVLGSKWNSQTPSNNMVLVTTRPALRIGERQTSIPYVIAVRSDAHDLVAALDRALAQIKVDGKLESILAQWLDRG